jgi:hypothetical protein
MKKFRYIFFAASFLQICFSIQTKAQKTDPAASKAPALKIVVDGDLKDWGDSLQYYNSDNNVHYAFSSDKDNLYFAVKIDDRPNAVRVLKGGITLSVDPKGKKKTAYNITFPLNMTVGSLAAAKQSDNFGEVTQEDRDELQRELLTTLRGIKVEGFKDIEGDMITTSNTYGIKTLITYDAKGNLVCEASIALKLLNANNSPKNEWLYDIKINGVSRPTMANKPSGDSPAGGGGHGGRGGMGGGGGGMGGGRGGRGGGGQRAATTEPNGDAALSRSAEFTGKFYLLN